MPDEHGGGYERELGGLQARLVAVERDVVAIVKELADRQKRITRLETWKSYQLGLSAGVAGLIGLIGLLINLWLSLR